MIRLSYVDAPHYVWPLVEPALERVKAKTGESWTPSFVLERIQSGNAGLFEFRGDSHIGWMVVERYAQGDEPWMNVWILEGNGLDEFGKDCLPLVDDLARKMGASTWRCTGRKGWGKAFGLRPIATVYERELI